MSHLSSFVLTDVLSPLDSFSAPLFSFSFSFSFFRRSLAVNDLPPNCAAFAAMAEGGVVVGEDCSVDAVVLVVEVGVVGVESGGEVGVGGGLLAISCSVMMGHGGRAGGVSLSMASVMISTRRDPDILVSFFFGLPRRTKKSNRNLPSRFEYLRRSKSVFPRKSGEKILFFIHMLTSTSSGVQGSS